MPWKFFDRLGQERLSSIAGFGSGNDQQVPVWDAASSSWKPKAGSVLIWDSADAGVSFPTASIGPITIPQVFKHLRIEMAIRTDQAANGPPVNLRMNGDTGANYMWVSYGGQNGVFFNGGAGIATNLIQLGAFAGASGVTNTVGVAVVTIPHYTNTTFFKSITSLFYSPMAETSATMILGNSGGEWKSLAAITSLTFLTPGNFITGSRISIYGE